MAGAIRPFFRFRTLATALAACAALAAGCDPAGADAPLAPAPTAPGPGTGPSPRPPSWVVVPPLPGERMQAAAVTLNNIIYVAGGVGSDGRPRPEILAFDPVENGWRVAGLLNVPVRAPAMVALNGLIYVVGGSIEQPWEPRADLQILDPSTGAVMSGPPMPTARLGLTAVVHERRKHAIGGVYRWDPGEVMGEWADFHEVYDPATGLWSDRAPLTYARSGHTAFSLAGRVFVSGGFTMYLESWDPVTDSWSTLGSPPGGFGASGVVLGSAGYVLGGTVPPQGCCGGWRTQNSVYCFDALTGGWTPMPSMPFFRSGHASTASGGEIYVIGGSPTGSIADASADVMRYRP